MMKLRRSSTNEEEGNQSGKRSERDQRRGGHLNPEGFHFLQPKSPKKSSRHVERISPGHLHTSRRDTHAEVGRGTQHKGCEGQTHRSSPAAVLCSHALVEMWKRLAGPAGSQRTLPHSLPPVELDCRPACR
ncbi:uncharacterized protein LOC124401350 isoform X22 [Silurus meridionalis]|uniref:uncharacterized protein LOC124401350 isoform X22 n=1 Tax=Silurus meridionalis TaxID=175797 RepID=UPI001EEA75A0|nr:uncharacterized protein LOC124401350 isoform X22 [Silurus meridionalis]